MDPVVHFEIPVSEFEKSKSFYSAAFGWQLDLFPGMKYMICRTAEVDEKHMPKLPGRINGGMLPRGGSIHHPVITINVQDIHASCKKVEELGGKIVMQPFAVGEIGISAYFQDPDGNVLGIWEEKVR